MITSLGNVKPIITEPTTYIKEAPTDSLSVISSNYLRQPANQHNEQAKADNDMKIKMLPDKTGRKLLKVSLSKKDVFDYAAAAHLANSPFACLLPFTLSGKERTPDLYYDTTEHLSLALLAGSKVSGQQFELIVEQLAEALDTIGAANLSEKNLLLTPEHVFLNIEDFRLQLVYLPVTGRVAYDRGALDLLRWFTASTLFVSEEDAAYAQRFENFLRGQEVLSVIKLKAYFGHGDGFQKSRQTGSALSAMKQQQVAGRDFVSERSGSLSKSQRAERFSFAESIMAEVSEDFGASAQSDLEHVSAEISKDFDTSANIGEEPTPLTFEYASAPATPLKPAPLPAFVQIATPSPSPSLASTPVPASVGQPSATGTGGDQTTFLASWSSPLSDGSPVARTDLRAWLTRESDARKWELPQGTATIGRSKACDLKVSDSTMVSRQHATLTNAGRGLVICDNESCNGTFVNGERVDSGQGISLDNGNIIELGDVRFFVTLERRERGQ